VQGVRQLHGDPQGRLRLLQRLRRGGGVRVIQNGKVIQTEDF
jgi:hypothetical protein